MTPWSCTLPDDFSQADDIAAQHPEKVRELRDLFWAEAEKYKVLPLLSGLSFYWPAAADPRRRPLTPITVTCRT
jgi:hypothetical protein